MLKLILQTQEGHQIELDVQPEDTFADLKSQYIDNESCNSPEFLEELITNGASIPKTTKIFDYISARAHEWLTTDMLQENQSSLLSEETEEAETKFKKCCAHGCLNTENTIPVKQFFPLPIDYDKLIICLIGIGRPDLCDTILCHDPEDYQKYFLCSDHFDNESSLSEKCTDDKGISIFMTPDAASICTESENEVLVTKESVKEEDGIERRRNYVDFREINNDAKDSTIFELSNTEDKLEHPDILCRLCGKVTVDPIYLYSTNNENSPKELSLADKINLCLPVTITATDPLPKQICPDCHVKLNVCHDLALLSLQTEDNLKKLMEESKLCVDIDRKRNCPLCKKGDMIVVRNSGVYRKEELEDDFVLKAESSLLSKKNDNATALGERKCRSEKCISSRTCVIRSDANFENSQELEAHCKCHESSEDKFKSVKSIDRTELESNSELFPGEAIVENNREEDAEGATAAREMEKFQQEVPKVSSTRSKARHVCKFCNKEFSRKGSLEKHTIALHNDCLKNSITSRCYKCRVCCEAFSHQVDAEAHARLSHLGTFADKNINPGQSGSFVDEVTVSCLYICEYCEHAFTTPSSLHEHRESEHAKIVRYSCATCNLSFETHRLLAKHKTLRSHRRQLGTRQLYVCRYCDKTFLHHSSHTSHVLGHREHARPYLCRICNVSFESYREISTHRDEAHPYRSTLHERSSLAYDCQYCRKQFSHEVALVKHIRMHTGERPYKCTICGKGFSQSSGLYTHLKIHSDARPFSCTKCPQTFKIKGDRDNHVKKHTGHRPYKCELCNKAFMTQHVYSQHCKIHTDVRPYKCELCGQAFRRSHVLTVHMRRHTGEKPHACDMCQKSYRQRGDLLKHRRMQHGVGNIAKRAHFFVTDGDPEIDDCSKSSKFTDIQGNSVRSTL